MGSAKQFISGPKVQAEEKFPKASIWVNQIWYTRIRCDIEATIIRRCIELGVAVEDKSEPVGRDLLILLNHLALTRGAVEDIEYRAALNMTFCAVGRAGECGLSTYNLAQYNTVYETFQLEWQERKTLAQKPMNFFPDAESFEIDFYHSMACYWVVGAGSQHISPATQNTGVVTPIFPFLVVGSAATKLTEYMRKLAPLTDNQVPAYVTATALRVGGVQEVVNRTADIVAGTIRGGWGGFLASVATIMEYYQQTHAVLSKGGRALAAWPDPTKHVHPPSCEPIFKDYTSATGRDKLKNFLSRLFRSSDYNVVTSKLSPFAHVMFASLLQYLQPFIDKYSVDHIVVKNLYEAAKEFQIKKKTLTRWGLLIDADWRARNMMNIANPADLAPVVTKLQKELLIVKDQNAELKHMLTEMRDLQISTARDTSNKLAHLLAMITLQDTPTNSIGDKRRRTSEPTAGEIPAATSGSEATELILSAQEGNAFSMLQQPKELVVFKASSALSQVIQTWYEKGFTVNDKPVQWKTVNPKDKHTIIKVIEYLETVWPPDVRAVLLAGPPDPASPEYLEWNTKRVAAANSAVAAIVAAIVVATKVPDKVAAMRDKKSVNALYNHLQNAELIAKK